MGSWRGRFGVVVLAASALLAVSAPSAFAGEGYGAVAGESTAGGGGSLPFTGADLALYAVVGLCLLVSGFALRGYARR